MRLNGKTTLVDFTKDVVQSLTITPSGLNKTILTANIGPYQNCGIATIAKGYTDITFLIGGATASTSYTNGIYIFYMPENTTVPKMVKLS